MVSLVHWSHLVTLVDQTNHYCLKWLKILVSTLYNKAIFIHFCQNDNFLMILSTSLRTSTVELSPFFIWQVGVTEPALQDRVKIIRWDDDGRVSNSHNRFLPPPPPTSDKITASPHQAAPTKNNFIFTPPPILLMMMLPPCHRN